MALSYKVFEPLPLNAEGTKDLPGWHRILSVEKKSLNGYQKTGAYMWRMSWLLVRQLTHLHRTLDLRSSTATQRMYMRP